MQILDTTPEIRRLFCGKPFDWNVWRRYADGISPSLAAKCEADIRDCHFERDIRPVLEESAKNRGALRELQISFGAAVQTLRRRLGILFESEPVIHILLYWGLCNGAGWATELDGTKAVLLGAEKIIELRWTGETDMKGLLFHEIGHLWHEQAGKIHPSLHSPREQSVWQLVEEGVAMVCEQQLVGDKHFYHQNKAGWLSWCLRHEAEIKRAALVRLENGKGLPDFFGDWHRFMGRADVGYFLGCRFIRHRLRNSTLPEIARLPYADLEAELLDFLQA